MNLNLSQVSRSALICHTAHTTSMMMGASTCPRRATAEQVPSRLPRRFVGKVSADQMKMMQKDMETPKYSIRFRTIKNQFLSS